MNQIFIAVIPIVALLAAWLYTSTDDKIGKASSIWCVRHVSGNKMCHLRDVAYRHSSQDIDFHLNDNSIISGLVSFKDLQKIQLSSIINHNKFHVSLTMSHNKSNACGESIDGSVLAIARIKPDNIMHVLHDDILPLYATLEYLCKGDVLACSYHYNLLLLDGNVIGPFSYLYDLFAKNVLYPSANSCFYMNDLHVGLNLDTVWYQYGFKRSRGPAIAPYFSSDILWRFRKFMLKKLNIEDVALGSNRTKVIILNRPYSRKILNVQLIVSFVKSVYGQSVECKLLDVKMNNIKYLIGEMQGAKLLIGMHGAELILSLFLPVNSTVIEIMPYGIPIGVSFLEPLRHSNMSKFNYFHWTNTDFSKTIRHPENPAYLGGIEHLTIKEQHRIKSLKSIDIVQCCDSPDFLHLMYQDTIIDDSFLNVVKKSYSSEIFYNKLSEYWLYPTPVQSLKCVAGVSVSWLPPRNMATDIQYFVTLKLGQDIVEHVTRESLVKFENNYTPESAWVSAVSVSTGLSSTDSFVKCNLVKEIYMRTRFGWAQTILQARSVSTILCTSADIIEEWNPMTDNINCKPNKY